MKKRIIVGVLISLFILDFILINTSNISFLDDSIYYFVISFKSDFLTSIFKIISFLASTRFIIFLCVLLIIYMIRYKKSDFILIVVASISSGIINNLVKFLIKRERPIGIALIRETFYSFPSGHAMISLLFYGSIIYLINKKKIKYYKVITVILGFFTLLVGLSRIYLGVHFASDILGGYFLSGAILIILISIINNYKRSEI